jgi:WD40 repeat protein
MSTDQIPAEPYKGLDPYEETDAEIFFGRKKDSRIIIANLFAASLTILYGKSGVGKSSVLRAGVAPQIYKRDDIIAIIFTDWEQNPLEKLKESVSITMHARLEKKKEDKIQDKNEVIESEFWLEKQDEKRVVEPALSDPLLEFLLGWTNLLKCRISIILDQFEDYLQYQDRDSFKTFANEFSTAVAQAKARVSFLISIREDSLAKLDRFEGKIPSLFDNYLRLEHLDESAAREVIEMPIHRYSDLCVKDGKRYTIERDLVDAVLEEVRVGSLARGSIGSKTNRVLTDVHVSDDQRRNRTDKYQLDTVFLQLVMQRLWKEEVKRGSHILQFSTLQALGGAHQIVQDHFGEVMKELTKDEQKITAEVFKYLVSPSGTKIDYPVHELFTNDDLSKRKLPDVLRKLSKGSNRILRQVAPTGTLTDAHYEIFHDALGPAILDWMTEKEERRSKRLKMWVALLSFLSIFFIITIIAAYKQSRIAETLRADAERQKNVADTQSDHLKKTLALMKQKELAIPFTKSVMYGHTDAITCMALSPDNEYLVTGSDDSTAKVWKVDDGSIVVDLAKHDAPVKDVTFSPNGQFIATASQDKTARIWDLNGTVRAVIRHDDQVNSVNFSSDSARIVTASADHTARIWVVDKLINTDLSQIDPTHQIRLIGLVDVVYMAEFSPDGKWILTISADNTARLWDAANGQMLRAFRGHTAEVHSAKFSKSLKKVVTASSDGTARVWDTSSGRMINLLKGHTAGVNSAEFDPGLDGNLVVTASSDGTARIWEAGSVNVFKVLRGHMAEVNAAKFSPDGARVVTSSDDKTARIWNAATGKPLIPLQGHLSEVNSAIFSSDNQSVATISNDQTARIWDASQFGGFKVLEAYAEQVSYQGTCPATVKFSGRIEVAEGSGEVRYRFMLGGKPIALGQKVLVNTSGTVYLTTFLKIRPSNSYRLSGMLVLEITEPNHVQSKEVPLKIRCYAKPNGLNTPPADTPTAPSSFLLFPVFNEEQGSL